MAHLPHKHHGNFPQGQATLLPRVAKSTAELALISLPSETSSNPATTEEPNLPAEHLGSIGFCKVEKESYLSCNQDTRAASPSTRKQQRKPGKKFAAFLKRISIHPEAQKILGNSCIPVVTLERLNLRSVLSSSSLQPVVSLVRLPCRSQAELHSEPTCLNCPQQNGSSETEEHILEIKQSKPAELPDLSLPNSTPTSWTEPLCTDNSLFEEPEQDSGFDCESNPDQAYILFDLGSDELDQDVRSSSETFYLDPDSDQTIVIEVDPELEPDQDQSLELVDESETKCEEDIVQIVDNEDQRPDLCCSKEEVESCILQPGPGPGSEEIESEDFCAVCLNGGDLLCCDRCPKVYHLACHVPPLNSFPVGDWVCTLCRTDQEPVEMYDCENMQSCGGLRAPYTLPQQDQRRCEKLTLLLYCHTLSAPFHEPVSPLARNYYQIIKRPINLSVIRRKLDKNNTLHYFSAEQFVDDVLLMFKNCATFNYPDSEVAQAGRNLEVFFLSRLMEIFPERTFPSTSQDMADKARLRWLSKKRKENCRRKKHVFTGKKYYL